MFFDRHSTSGRNLIGSAGEGKLIEIIEAKAFAFCA
jgi:hypothetical protein